MSQLIWIPEYSVGVAEFDEHHKRIFDIINRLDASINKPNVFPGDILSELHDYADYHLKAEEGYFEKIGYADSAEHIGEHDYYRQAVKAFIDEKESGMQDFLKLLDFLNEWWIHHIQEVDKKYTQAFHEAGVY